MTIIILIITVIVSLIAFNNEQIYRRFLFNPYMVQKRNQYDRFITSGLIHGDWIHLFVNMFVFYSFGRVVEYAYQYHFDDKYILNFLLLYIGSMVFADISSFYKHRNDPGYNSLGASGAVSAIVFASIVFAPLRKIYLFAIVPLPGIVLGILYLVFSAYMARGGHGAINHEAHFYGAVFGFVFTILLKPTLFLLFLEKLGLG